MGATDSIPVVSQAKSAVQYVRGDKEGAYETQTNFSNTCIGVSQAKSAYQWWDRDTKGAKETQKKYINGVSNFADGVPVVGHVKGAVHYVCGDKDGGNKAMKSASRTVGVIGGGAIGGLTLGPVGAIAGGIAGGAAVDGVTTGIESAVEGEYRPSGQIAAVTRMYKREATVGEVFDSGFGLVADGFAGYGAGKTAIKLRDSRNSATLYRVGHEGEVQNSIKTGEVTGRAGGEVWVTDSKAKAQAFYESRPFADKATMEIQVPKEFAADLKSNAIPQNGYRSAVNGVPKAGRPNMFNMEGITEPGAANIGIKGKAYLAQFNKNVVNVQKAGTGNMVGVKPGAPLVAAGGQDEVKDKLKLKL